MRRALPRLRQSLSLPPRHQFPPQISKFSTTTTTFRQQGQEEENKKTPLPLQDKIRRKLWGTETPPGPADPYTTRQEETELATQPEETSSAIATSEEPESIRKDGYVQAKDGRGLRVVGLDPEMNSWEIPAFLPQTPLTTPEAIHRAVHRAVVEVFTYSLNNLPLETPADMAYVGPDHVTMRVKIFVAENGEARFEYGSEAIEKLVLGVEEEKNGEETAHGSEAIEELVLGVEKEEKGEETAYEDTGSAVGDVGVNAAENSEVMSDSEALAAKQEVLEAGDNVERELDNPSPENHSESTPESPAPTDKITISTDGKVEYVYAIPEGIKDMLQGRDLYDKEPDEELPWLKEGLAGEGWVRLGLNSNEIKFSVIKRVQQLTGIKIHDPAITQIKTVHHLLEHMITKPPPKKLVELLIEETELPNLPNVKVFASRVRPLDKERAIGRARPLEQALEYRYPFEKEVRGV